MAKIRLGIYGGTFSPPHLGHVSAARSFVRGADLDKLIIMPDFTPPHKLDFGNATAEDRLEMCRIAFADVPCTEVSDFEILRGGKSYTYVTLEAFAKENVDLFFLCGTEAFKIRTETDCL
jgi:nicotinate-nucleotide adenylyltransferase